MYRIVEAHEKVRVPPHLTKREIKEAIIEVLREKYENTVLREVGYIIDIIDAKPLGESTIVLGDPNIYYETKYKMLAFTVEPGEIYRGIVKDVIDFGAFVVIGPFEGLLHISQISKERFVFDKAERALVSADKKKKIKPGDILLVRVSTVSMKGSPEDVKISLTMRGEGLGKIEWFETAGGKKK